MLDVKTDRESGHQQAAARVGVPVVVTVHIVHLMLHRA
jgi:hypothetical protein